MWSFPVCLNSLPLLLFFRRPTRFIQVQMVGVRYVLSSEPVYDLDKSNYRPFGISSSLHNL